MRKKNALETTEMSGFRSKKSCFEYIKQNSIAEIVSTMESFLCCAANLDATAKKSIKSRSFQFLGLFHVHPK